MASGARGALGHRRGSRRRRHRRLLLPHAGHRQTIARRRQATLTSSSAEPYRVTLAVSDWIGTDLARVTARAWIWTTLPRRISRRTPNASSSLDGRRSSAATLQRLARFFRNSTTRIRRIPLYRSLPPASGAYARSRYPGAPAFFFSSSLPPESSRSGSGTGRTAWPGIAWLGRRSRHPRRPRLPRYRRACRRRLRCGAELEQVRLRPGQSYPPRQKTHHRLVLTKMSS